MTTAVLLNKTTAGHLAVVGTMSVPATVDPQSPDVALFVFAQRDVDHVQVWDNDRLLSSWGTGPQGTALAV